MCWIDRDEYRRVFILCLLPHAHVSYQCLAEREEERGEAALLERDKKTPKSRTSFFE